MALSVRPFVFSKDEDVSLVSVLQHVEHAFLSNNERSGGTRDLDDDRHLGIKGTMA